MTQVVPLDFASGPRYVTSSDIRDCYNDGDLHAVIAKMGGKPLSQCALRIVATRKLNLPSADRTIANAA